MRGTPRPFSRYSAVVPSGGPVYFAYRAIVRTSRAIVSVYLCASFPPPSLSLSLSLSRFLSLPCHNSRTCARNPVDRVVVLCFAPPEIVPLLLLLPLPLPLLRRRLVQGEAVESVGSSLSSNLFVASAIRSVRRAKRIFTLHHGLPAFSKVAGEGCMPVQEGAPSALIDRRCETGAVHTARTSRHLLRGGGRGGGRGG